MDKAWFLESIAADGSRRMQAIRQLPFRVGREAGSNDLVVDALGLSRHHATLEADASGQLKLSDLGSTNGTFVNRERIEGPRLVGENDIIHFGDAEFRLGDRQAEMQRTQTPTPADSDRTMIVPRSKPRSEHFVPYERQFLELLRGRGLGAAVQPIVRAGDGSLYAYELLGRCHHPEMPLPPVHLFKLAEQLDREAELSAAFRRVGIPAIAPRLHGAKLFVNTHPKETFEPAFFDGLAALRALPGAPEIVVEVHETAVVEIERMRDLAARLAEIGVPFAYDDFGAGQARLNELGEVPAHYVKFDMGLIRGIHEATERKQKLLGELVRLVLNLGSVALAEGVELEAEAAICRDMGFQLIQGYLTGRPVTLEIAGG